MAGKGVGKGVPPGPPPKAPVAGIATAVPSNGLVLTAAKATSSNSQERQAGRQSHHSLKRNSAEADAFEPLTAPLAAWPEGKALRLWGNLACPYVHMVRIVLREMDLMEITEDRFVDIFNKEQDLEFMETFRRSILVPGRRPQIPLLEHMQGETDYFVLCESDIIAEYLDGALSPGRILPGNPRKRSEVRFFVDTFNREVAPLWSSVFKASDDDSLYKVAEEMRAAFGILDQGLIGASPFVAGEFGFAEALTAPFLQRLVSVAPHFRPLLTKWVDLSFSKFPRLRQWSQAVLERPSVRRTYHHDEVLKIVQKTKWRGTEA